MSITLNAKSRADKGKGASRRLRHSGEIPAIIYGAGKDASSITLNVNSITNMLEDETVYTSIIDIDVDGAVDQGIIKDIQRHPAKNVVTHVDFQRVDANVALTTRIPLNFIGAADNKYIRLGAVVNRFISMVEVSCLPKDLPHVIDVDISAVKIGGSLRLTDLTIGEGVMITALNHTDVEAYNQTVVAVSAARKMAEIDEDDEAEAPSAEAEGSEES